MTRLIFAFIFPLLCAAAPAAPSAAPAAQEPEADSEQLSEDMIDNIDDWLGQVGEKLQSDEPVDSKDFDSLFGASLSGSADPERDLELAKERIYAKLGDNPKINAAYDKWMRGKISSSGTGPEITDSPENIMLRLKAPGSVADSVKVSVRKGRIQLNYLQKIAIQDLKPDGSVYSTYYSKKRQRALAVPRNANPDKYRVRTSNEMVYIVFDRLNKGSKHTEASK